MALIILGILIGGWFLNGVCLAIYDDFGSANFRRYLAIVPYAFVVYIFGLLWLLILGCVLCLVIYPFLLFWDGCQSVRNHKTEGDIYD